MAQYTAMYKSSKLTENLDEIESIINQEVVPDGEPEDDPTVRVPRWQIDGQFVRRDGAAWFQSSSTTFEVWSGKDNQNVTEEFLEELSEVLDKS